MMCSENVLKKAPPFTKFSKNEGANVGNKEQLEIWKFDFLDIITYNIKYVHMVFMARPCSVSLLYLKNIFLESSKTFANNCMECGHAFWAGYKSRSYLSHITSDLFGQGK